MRSRLIGYPLALAGFALLPFLAGAAVSQTDPAARAFLEENRRAMSTMDHGMMAPPTGDVDRDFVQMMVPHHQGAIDMAIAELRYGHNERLRRIAQEIIIDQQQEIAAMRLALGEGLPPSAPAPTQPDRRGSDPLTTPPPPEK